jgi:hypothetical protein
MTILKYAFDGSCMSLSLNGVYPLVGVQEISLGDGMELGKEVVQMGDCGPFARTRGMFKGDSGFSIKIHDYGAKDFITNLTANGIPGPDGIHSIVVPTLNFMYRLPNNIMTTIICYQVQFVDPGFSGAMSSDSRDSLVREYKFGCMNRSIDGFKAWTENDTPPITANLIGSI